MVTQVIKTIGSGGDYSTPQTHEDDGPTSYTTSRSANARTGSTSSTIVLDNGASATNDFYKGHPVWINTRSSEIRLITAYNGSTKTATIGSYNDSSATWANIPANGETFTVDATIWTGRIKNASDAFSTSSSGVTLLTVSGAGVSSSAYYELSVASGASFADNANAQTNALRYNASNGCSMSSTAPYASLINDNQDFSRFSLLQLSASGVFTGSAYVKSSGSTADIDKCIIASTANKVINVSGAGFKIRNSLVILRGASKTEVAAFLSSAQAINCTFAVPSDITKPTQIITVSYAAGSFKNCAFFGNGAALRGGNAPTYTTCYTDAASPPSGVSSATYSTSTFGNITDATADYKLVSGSALVDTGTTDANAANDILNTARPQGSAYDVGAHELVVAAGQPAIRRFGVSVRDTHSGRSGVNIFKGYINGKSYQPCVATLSSQKCALYSARALPRC